MRIGIVNMSIGNVGSVLSAFGFYGCDASLVDAPAELSKVDAIVLAGVGNFKTASAKLDSLGFRDALNEQVLGRGKPVLGICLGMQLFADVGFEDGETAGFGWIKGRVARLAGRDIRVPHMGWNTVEPVRGPLFEGVRYGSFYFMHGYHFIPESREAVMGLTRYGEVEIVSAIGRDNIHGVQFHPEKSQGDGLRVLRNFMRAAMARA